jgi:rod shape-determining protein MreC
MQSVVLENERLKQLMSFGDEIAHKKILAQVIGWDANNEFKVLRVNKGSKDGIEPRMPVITSSGLVGYTFKVSYHFTDILTVLDQNNRVDVIVERSRSFGVVEGVSQSECRMKYVDRSEPIEVGDLLITAGYGELYPKGIKVGTVKSVVKEDYALTQNVKVEPSVQFQKLEEVVVLKFEMKKEALSEQVIK